MDDVLLHFINGFFNAEKEAIKTSTHPQTQQNAPQLCQFLDDMNHRLKTEFQDRLAQFTNDYHVNPIEMTVGAMPKEELAKMAQSLVNLTAIKRRSTPDAETVGGPTDVAVITKGDGMIWIDRKHYFDASLNPGFVSNYFQKGTS